MLDQFAKLFNEFKDLRTEFKEFKTEMGTEFKEFKTEMGTEFKEFKTEMGTEFKEFKHDINTELQDFRKDISVELAEIKKKLEFHDERFDRLDAQIIKLGAVDQSDIEKVARQVEQLVVGMESFQTETKNTLENMQYDINYLVRKSSTHDDDIIQLKKAK